MAPTRALAPDRSMPPILFPANGVVRGPGSASICLRPCAPAPRWPDPVCTARGRSFLSPYIWTPRLSLPIDYFHFSTRSLTTNNEQPTAVFLPAFQFRDLHQVAAGILQYGDLGRGDVGWRHCKFSPARFHSLVIGLQVVSEKHDCWLVLLKNRLLIRFRRRIVVERQLQFRAVRILLRGHCQPAVWALAEIGFLGESQHVRVKVQGLLLIVYIYASNFD